MDILNLPIPPKPDYFGPDGAPPGVVCDFEAFRGSDGRAWWKSRPQIEPRVPIVHTNAASKEGTLASQINWGNSNPGSRTHPHYAVNYPQPTKLVPSDRRAIANSTEDWVQVQEDEEDCSFWTIAIETADSGSLADPKISDFLTSSVYGPIEVPHAEIVARILAYESIVWEFPLEVPAEWNGSGCACHTWPFPWPYYTIEEGKTCPGSKKIWMFQTQILPRARKIRDAWLGISTPNPSFPQEDDMAPVCFTVGRTGTAEDPAPVWLTTDGVTAVRVTPYFAAKRGLPQLHVKSEAECEGFLFVDGLEFVPAV